MAFSLDDASPYLLLAAVILSALTLLLILVVLILIVIQFRTRSFYIRPQLETDCFSIDSTNDESKVAGAKIDRKNVLSASMVHSSIPYGPPILPRKARTVQIQPSLTLKTQYIDRKTPYPTDVIELERRMMQRRPFPNDQRKV